MSIALNCSSFSIFSSFEEFKLQNLFKDFFVNRYLEQIIIPEIQRDYVWGEEQAAGLLNSINDDFNNYLTKIPAIQTGNDPTYIDYYKRTFLTSNIGFSVVAPINITMPFST